MKKEERKVKAAVRVRMNTRIRIECQVCTLLYICWHAVASLFSSLSSQMHMAHDSSFGFFSFEAGLVDLMGLFFFSLSRLLTLWPDSNASSPTFLPLTPVTSLQSAVTSRPLLLSLALSHCVLPESM